MVNAAQRHTQIEESGIQNKKFFKNKANVFVSLPSGQLSASQLLVIASATEKFLNKDHIEFTENLNISFGLHKESRKQEIFRYFIQSGLLSLGCDTAITHQGTCEEIRAEDKVIIANITQEKFSTSMINDLAGFMRVENIQDIHLVNEKEFVFIYTGDSSADTLGVQLKEMGINLRAVL